MEEGERESGGGTTKALESWREPWVGNDPESSRSTAAGTLIQKQNAERVRIWNTDGGGGGRDLRVQQLSIDQRLKNCTLKSLLTSKS